MTATDIPTTQTWGLDTRSPLRSEVSAWCSMDWQMSPRLSLAIDAGLRFAKGLMESSPLAHWLKAWPSVRAEQDPSVLVHTVCMRAIELKDHAIGDSFVHTDVVQHTLRGGSIHGRGHRNCAMRAQVIDHTPRCCCIRR
jgi:hypothetical protein